MMRATPAAEKACVELIAADEAFCANAQKAGPGAAFLSLVTDQAKMLGIKTVTGLAAVHAGFDHWPAGATLTWEPSFAESSDAGDLGYTYGRYVFRMKVKNVDTDVESGTYVTIWKRQPDQSWKIVLDGGQPDPEPKKS